MIRLNPNELTPRIIVLLILSGSLNKLIIGRSTTADNNSISINFKAWQFQASSGAIRYSTASDTSHSNSTKKNVSYRERIKMILHCSINKHYMEFSFVLLFIYAMKVYKGKWTLLNNYRVFCNVCVTEIINGAIFCSLVLD